MDVTEPGSDILNLRFRGVADWTKGEGMARLAHPIFAAVTLNPRLEWESIFLGLLPPSLLLPLSFLGREAALLRHAKNLFGMAEREIPWTDGPDKKIRGMASISGTEVLSP